MAKILITGTAGFVFSNFFLYTLQHTNHEIISVDSVEKNASLYNISFNSDINMKRHKFYLGSIADYDFISKLFSIERPEIVINGAGVSSITEGIENSKPHVCSNYIGTHSLLEASRKYMPSLFIQFSSDSVYGSTERVAFEEEDKLNPIDPYSATKAGADLLCKSYFDTYKVPIITARSCNIFGARQHVSKLIPRTIFNLLNNQEIEVYNEGKDIREWIFVKDVFMAIRTLMGKGKIGEIYNIGSGKELRNIDLVKKIARMMDKTNLIKPVSKTLGSEGRFCVNSDKLKKLGWKPSYDLDEALEYTISWYMKNSSWAFGRDHEK